MLAITTDGGIIQAVVSDDPAMVGLDILIIDYDTEGAERRDVFKVAQFTDGKRDGTADAVCYVDKINAASGIDLTAVYRDVRNRE